MSPFKNILYVVEGSADQSSALERAVSLAETGGAGLTIMHVVPPAGEDLQKEILAERIQAMEAMTEPFQRRLKIKWEVRTGVFFLEVIRAVLSNSYDLVMKAAENPGFLRKLFGGSDMHLLRKCPCPLWLMKLPEKPAYETVMAAIDFDPLKHPTPREQELNRLILKLSGAVALADGAAFHVVHAWDAFAETTLRSRRARIVDDISMYVEKERGLHQTGLQREMESLKDLIGTDAFQRLAPRLHLPNGDARQVLPSVASNLKADLVVMGTVARTGIPGFIIGNTAEMVLDQLESSVLAVKPPGFVTPVNPVD